MLPLVFRFCHRYMTTRLENVPGQRRKVEVHTVYAAKTKNSSEFRFHIGMLKEFMAALKSNYVLEHMYTVETLPIYEPLSVDIKLKPGWVLRDDQEEASEFIMDESLSDYRSRLLAMGTGTGKTVTSLITIQRMGFRSMVMVLPVYINKWTGDIEGIYETRRGDILEIRGSDALKSLFQLAVENKLKAKFIVVSLTTYRMYLKLYELHGDDIKNLGYCLLPDEVGPVLQLGSVLYDEVHQHLHAVYKTMMYFHVPKVIALSATVLSTDNVISRVQHAMFPAEIRFTKISMRIYIRVIALEYHVREEHRKHLRLTERGQTTYSHTAYEQSIMRYKPLYEGYMTLILETVYHQFHTKYKPGDKLMIYAARVDLCGEIVKRIQKAFPNYSTARYCEKDNYQNNCIDPDIRVSNLIKSGTAIDIKGLRVVIMTNSLKSEEGNLQALGRLREIEDRDVTFVYLWCGNLKKQYDYHCMKKDLFARRVASIKELRYPLIL